MSAGSLDRKTRNMLVITLDRNAKLMTGAERQAQPQEKTSAVIKQLIDEMTSDEPNKDRINELCYEYFEVLPNNETMVYDLYAMLIITTRNYIEKQVKMMQLMEELKDKLAQKPNSRD